MGVEEESDHFCSQQSDCKANSEIIPYIAGNFRGVQFSQMVDLYHSMGLMFMDATHLCPLCTVQSSLFRR